MPPTPQPITPSALIIGVWLSQATSESAPACAIASRIAATSASMGTPEESGSTTRVGFSEMPRSECGCSTHAASARMSSAVTVSPSSKRSRFSSSTRRDTGRRRMPLPSFCSAAARLKMR